MSNSSSIYTLCILAIIILSFTNIANMSNRLAESVGLDSFEPSSSAAANVTTSPSSSATDATITTTAPKVVWLMSFPNSGTSITAQIVRAYSNRATATNYGDEHTTDIGSSVPLHDSEGYINGPFLVATEMKRLVGDSVLTKTHCCTRCHPDSFKESCLTAYKGFIQLNGTLTVEKHQYSQELVHGAVHLMRDPFDNIVSRFHLARKQHILKNTSDHTFDGLYPNNPKGFRSWCHDLSVKYENFPCESDFSRYVKWHNHAFQLIDNELAVPSIVVHYEDWSSDFEGLKNEILDLLGDDEDINKRVSFVGGKKYRSYFTTAEYVAIKNMIFKQSSSKTRKMLRRYFVN